MKHLLNIITCSILILIIQCQLKAQTILPLPNKIQTGKDQLIIEPSISIQSNQTLQATTDYLKRILQQDFKILSSNKKNATKIKLALIPNLSSNTEAYKLTIDEKGIKIEAAAIAGIFYGIQSLRQLIYQKDSKLIANHTIVTDEPQFKIRSFMLDEARYFKGKEVVMQLMDEMALLKMNTFHWHLTDDQGWRIEIKKYPLLTAIGSKRNWSQIGGFNSKNNDGKEHFGFYKQQEIRDIIEYAKQRHINIIPEIEMPGHSTAAVAAYPYLGVTKQTVPTTGTFGVHYNIFDVSDPKVISFLKTVLDEVMSLFPSKIIHIGGDEVKYEQWNASPKVRQFMKAKNLSSPSDLQVYFTNQMSNYINSKGRRMMGWNDIMGARIHDYNTADAPATGKLSPKTIVQFWKGERSSIKSTLEQGYDIVNSFHEYTYLDYGFNDITLEKAYEFNPIPADLETKYKPQVLGIGAQMWGEWIPTNSTMNERIFPRLAAYAETGWTNQEIKDFKSFKKRMSYFYKTWTDHGINFHKFSD